MKEYNKMTKDQLVADAEVVAANVGNVLGITFENFNYGYEGEDFNDFIFPEGDFSSRFDVVDIVHTTAEEFAHPSDGAQPWAIVHNGTLALGIEEMTLIVSDNKIEWNELDEDNVDLAFHTPTFWKELADKGVDIPNILKTIQGWDSVTY